MAGLVPADIHPATERIVRPPNAASQRVRPVRDGNQVDVIGHQAVAQQLHVMKLAVFGEQFQVEFPVSIREESSGAVIAALRDMLGHANGDHASDSRHLQDIVASAADSSHPKSGIVVTAPLGRCWNVTRPAMASAVTLCLATAWILPRRYKFTLFHHSPKTISFFVPK